MRKPSKKGMLAGATVAPSNWLIPVSTTMPPAAANFAPAQSVTTVAAPANVSPSPPNSLLPGAAALPISPTPVNLAHSLSSVASPEQVGAADPISSTIMLINTNPYIIGLFMLLLNLGGRFLAMELTKKQEEFLQSRWIRPLLFFTVIFISTRNLAVAFWVTVLFFLIVWVVANENSPYCLIPSWCGHNVEEAKKNYEQNIMKLRGAVSSFQ